MSASLSERPPRTYREKGVTDAAARYRAGKTDFSRYLQWKTQTLDPTESAVHQRLQKAFPALGMPVRGAFRSHQQLPAMRAYDAREFAAQLRRYAEQQRPANAAR